METTADRSRPASLIRLAPRFDPQALSVWLLAFGLVSYLALKGGGYDSILRNQLGLAVWWALLLGLAVGALPVRRLGRGAWVALGLLAAYVVWVALSSSWSESSERTVVDLGRVATYLGIFALALGIRGSRGARRVVGALGAAIVLVSVLALLSRLHPAWFPHADQTADFLSGTRNRLSYPVNFWNGLAAFVAIGLPLILSVASSAHSIALRCLAAGAMPAMALTIFFTYSRGGTGAAILGLVVFIAFTHQRLASLATLAVAAGGSAILIVAATQRNALSDGLLSHAARQQGDEMLGMVLVVCGGVALLQAGISLALRHGRAPRWARLSRNASLTAAVGIVGVVLIALVAIGAPGRASDALHDFKSSGNAGNGAERLTSFQGNGRYQYWGSALDENSTDSLRGTGSGTFEFWWSRNGTLPGFVRDAHSLYAESLGELGLVGFALIVGFLVWSVGLGAVRCVRAVRDRRTQLAAALGGCAAFCLAAGFDWVWELGVVAMAPLLLISVLVTAGAGGENQGLPVPARAIGVLAALAAMVAIAIPLGTVSSVRESQAQAASSDLPGALSDARDAAGLAPFAATPRLQEALILEEIGRLGAADEAAREATDREPTNWRLWVIRSRIEAERHHVRRSISAYLRARSLNPRSALFAR